MVTGGPDEARVLRVRRLADVEGRLRRRRQYEVGCWLSGQREPTWLRRTEHPRRLLRAEGVHSTDVHDVVARADGAWRGGTGPSRGAWPDDPEVTA